MRGRAPFRGTLRAFAPALALSVAGLAVACADDPTSPGAPRAGAAALSRAADKVAGATSGNASSYAVSRSTAGDTAVTVFVVGTNAAAPASFDIGHGSKVDFPAAASSICDPATASYGPGTWDAPCRPATSPVTITAKAWLTADGTLATDFRPALRFTPGLKRAVTLTLKDPARAGTRVDYCTESGCVDEALADPSLATVLDPANGKVTRPVKHFSGYTVVANRSRMY